MTALLLLLAMLPTVQSGTAKEYRNGLMERVYSIRIHQKLVAPGWAGGLASTPSCSNIGRIIRARFRSPVTFKYSATQRLLVVDCSRPGADQRRHLREGLIVEVDYGTACATGWCRWGRTQAVTWFTGGTWR